MFHYPTLGYSKSNPCTGLDSPWRVQEFEAPRFHDNQHMKVVRLSALSTGRLYLPGNNPGTYYYSYYIIVVLHISPAWSPCWDYWWQGIKRVVDTCACGNGITLLKFHEKFSASTDIFTQTSNADLIMLQFSLNKISKQGYELYHIFNTMLKFSANLTKGEGFIPNRMWARDTSTRSP